MEHAEHKRFLRSEVQEATTITSRKYKSSGTTAGKNNCCTTPVDNGSLKSSYGYLEKSEKEVLEERGIRIEDSDLKNFANLTPTEVADFYKGLGEWQDVLPKTDYSYSPMSDYYKKKINGRIPVIPNMSRRDIWKNNWDNTEINDNAINSYYAEQYKSTRKRSWFSFSADDKPSKVRRSSFQAPQLKYSKFTSTTNTIKQWISEKFSRLSTPPYRRWGVSLETIRRNISWKRFSFSSSSFVSSNATNTTSKTLFQYSFLIIFLLLMYALFSFSPSDSLAKSTSTIGSSLNRVVESAFGLVYNVVDLTYSSVSFIFSSISWPDEYTLNSVCNFVFTPLYEFGILLVSWRDTKPASAGDREPLDNAQLEELFRRLFDASNSELVYKIINSPDFASFIDGKLKTLEEQNGEKLEKLFNDRRDQNSVFEERIKRLETFVAEWKLSEEIERLRQEVSSLREEIRSTEKRVEHDVVVLLSTVFQVEREGDQTNFGDLKNKFVAMFQSIEEAHRKIDKLNVEFTKYASNASENIDIAMEYSRERIKFDLRSFIEELISRKMDELKTAIPPSTGDGSTMEHVDQLEKYIKDVVGKALEIYDADKTGLADFALESSGGIILSTRCTETKTANAQFSILGIPLWQTSRSPRTVIQPGVHPGECWAFPGSTGFLVIQLSERIVVTGVTVEHIPRSLASNGTIDSAPKDFSVWALRDETDAEPKLLGIFQFEAEGPSLQYYEATRLNEPYQIVELKILSNHGKIDYTCLYRFRVHGVPA